MDVVLNKFGQGDCSGATYLQYIESESNFVCADEVGNLHFLSMDTDESRDTTLGDFSFNAIAVHPSENSMVLAVDEILYLRSGQGVEDSGAVTQIGNVTLRISQLQFDRDGKHLFVASEEKDIQVFTVENGVYEPSFKISTSRGIKSMQFSYNFQYMSCVNDRNDVSIVAFGSNMMSKENNYKIYDTEYSISKVVPDIELSYKASFHPHCDNQHAIIAIPTSEGAVTVCERKLDGDNATWVESLLLSVSDCSHRNNAVHLACFSPNGKYLVTADISGKILVWVFNSINIDQSEALRQVLFHNSDETAVLRDLAWGPKATDDYIAVVVNDAWATLRDVVHFESSKAKLPLPAATDNTITASVSPAKPTPTPKTPAAGANTGTQQSPQSLSESQFLQQMDVTDANLMNNTAADDFFNTLDFDNLPVPNQAASKHSVIGIADQDAVDVASDMCTESSMQQELDDLLAMSTAPTTVKFSSASNGVAAANPSNAARVTSGASNTLKRLKRAGTDRADTQDDDLFNEDEPLASTGNTTSSNKPTENIAAIKARTLTAPVGAQVLDSDDEGQYIDEVDDDAVDDILHGAEHNPHVSYGSNYTPTPLQEPFQPACTKFDEKQRRYLVWNSIGNITLRADSIDSRVEIRFTSMSRNNKHETFQDRSGFTMAALSYEGAAFATEAEEVTDNDMRDPDRLEGSTIYYHAFSGQHQIEGRNNSFRYTLGEHEAVLAIACGQGWLAVATSKGLLRIYSSNGVEALFLDLKGKVVCLCGYEDKLAVIYHGGAPIGNTSHLHLDLLQIEWRNGLHEEEIVCNLTVPLSEAATLSWIGFDVDNHVVAVMDSASLVRCLTYSAGWQWVRMLDVNRVKKSVDHVYWPIMISSDKLVYVLLNGFSKPAIYPQPVLSVKPLRLPVGAKMDGRVLPESHRELKNNVLLQKMRVKHLQHLKAKATHTIASTGVEENAHAQEQLPLLEQQLHEHSFDADRWLLKYFQDCCSKQNTAMALTLGTQLHLDESYAVAITIANHFGRASVAEALDAALQFRQDLRLAAELQQQQQDQQNLAAVDDHDDDDNNDVSNQPDYTDAVDASHVQEDLDALLHDDYSAPQAAAVDEARSNTLSSKVHDSKQHSFWNKLRPPSSTSNTSSSTSIVGTKRIVSPDGAPAHNENNLNGVAFNPFAVQHTGSTPNKRKNVLVGLAELKASPSPKKPALSRQTSFSQQARQKKFHSGKF